MPECLCMRTAWKGQERITESWKPPWRLLKAIHISMHSSKSAPGFKGADRRYTSSQRYRQMDRHELFLVMHASASSKTLLGFRELRLSELFLYWQHILLGVREEEQRKIWTFVLLLPDVLRMLRWAISRCSLHHHHPAQDAVLPVQHHLSLPLAYHPQSPRLLAATRLWREDNSGHHRASGFLCLHAAYRWKYAGYLRVRSPDRWSLIYTF